MGVLLTGLFIVIIAWFIRSNILPIQYLKKIDQQHILEDDYCVIDVRDYVSAHNQPFPSAENIPLSYLPRVLQERFDCTKDIVLISDDFRGVRLAAKLIRKRNNRPIYYLQNE